MGSHALKPSNGSMKLACEQNLHDYKEHNMSRYLAYCSRKELSNMISPCAELFQGLIMCADCALRFRW